MQSIFRSLWGKHKSTLLFSLTSNSVLFTVLFAAKIIMVTVTSSLFKDTDVDCVKIEIQSNSFLSLVPQTVKNTPAMQETQVLSLS